MNHNVFRSHRALIAVGIALLALIVSSVAVWAAVSIQANVPQCAARASGGTACDWTNGNITGSSYVEGTGVPQSDQGNKLHSATGSTDVYSFTWSTTFSSNNVHHGYDWIISYDQATAVYNDQLGAPLNIAPCTGAADDNQSGHVCQKLRHIPPYDTAPASYYYTLTVPDDSFISGSALKNGSVLERIQAFEAKYGERYVGLWTDQPLTGTAYIKLAHTLDDSNFTPIGNGGDAIPGDTLVRYTVYFTTSAEMVMFEYAGHFGISGDPYVDPLAWGWDQTSGGYGAGGLTGSNWHVKDFKLNLGTLGTLGSQDNQAGVTVNSLYPIVSKAIWNPTTKRATDMISMTTSSSFDIAGTIDYWACSDTTVPITDTLINGCTSTTTATYVGSSLTTINAKNAYATSPIFTPTVSGEYCFLEIFTPVKNANGLYNFAPTASTNGLLTGAGSECFLAYGPNAVALSSVKATAVGNEAPIVAILLGLLAVVASITVWKLRTGRRSSTP